MRFKYFVFLSNIFQDWEFRRAIFENLEEFFLALENLTAYPSLL